MSHLTKDKLGETAYARFWKKDATWEMSSFGTMWECKFNIHVNGANHNTRPLNMNQAKTLTLAQILQDKNTSNPFVCEVTLAAIEPDNNMFSMSLSLPKPGQYNKFKLYVAYYNNTCMHMYS